MEVPSYYLNPHHYLKLKDILGPALVAEPNNLINGLKLSKSPQELEWAQGEVNREVLKRALFYGGVMGSFAVERFGTERLQNLSREAIDARFQVFRELTHLG